MARNLYEDILMREKLMEMCKGNPGINWDILNEKLIELKRKARRVNAKKHYHFSADEVVFGNSFETAIFKYPLPEDIKTLADAEEYFEEYEQIECMPSQYDCTGQTFTSWWKIFRKPDGRFWVYHAIDMDV